MITLRTFPKNKEVFVRLLAFLKEILEICGSLGIEPVLNASLAVFVYTKNAEMSVNDIDLLIPEKRFEDTTKELEKRGIEFQIKDYHVLRIIKDDLKIEFDSMDYWTKEWQIQLPSTFDQVQIQGLLMNIIDLPNLIHTYKVGSRKNTVRTSDYKTKYKALTSILSEGNI